MKQSNTYQYMFVLGDLNADLSTTSGNKLKQLCLVVWVYNSYMNICGGKVKENLF